MGTSIEQLCKGYPPEFRMYFEYVRSLRFEDRPDYDYMKRMLRELFYRKGYEQDMLFDWDLQEEKRKARLDAMTTTGGGGEEGGKMVEENQGEKKNEETTTPAPEMVSSPRDEKPRKVGRSFKNQEEYEAYKRSLKSSGGGSGSGRRGESKTSGGDHRYGLRPRK